MNTIQMTEAIIAAKTSKGVTWGEIADAIGLSDVFTTSVALGQNSLSPEDAKKMGDFLDLSPEVVTQLSVCPMKAVNIDEVSKDPLVYRLFEIAYVYGGSIKEVIHEKFGDGIMSAIDFTCTIDKVEDPKGDRVLLTMNGKFLPYKKW